MWGLRLPVSYRQLLPVQVLVHAPMHDWVQLPPLHVSVQLAEPLHDCRQFPPEQANVHDAPDGHDWVQLPPAQSLLQLPDGQVWVQFPFGHSPETLPGVSTVSTEQPARARNETRRKALDLIVVCVCRVWARPRPTYVRGDRTSPRVTRVAEPAFRRRVRGRRRRALG
jgi:hypothetical protein